MSNSHQPTLLMTDWNEEWKSLQEDRDEAHGSSYWDERSKTYPTSHGSQKDYIDRFIEMAHVQPGETVLDMGCGTGALAIPLALQGVNVIAADFSRGMLEVLRKDIDERGVNNIDVRLVDWFDDWAEHGLGRNSVDYVFASRSIVTNDLQDSLMKATRTARKRVCITLPASPSPRADSTLMEAAGLPFMFGQDMVYAFNILVHNGVFPEVAPIRSVRTESFDSADEAFEKFGKIARSAARNIATPEQLGSVDENLKRWLDENLVENDRAGLIDGRGHVEKAYTLKTPRTVTWAFMAWDAKSVD